MKRADATIATLLGEGDIFLDFFYLLRANAVPVSVREWLTWLECIERGLIAADLGRAYSIGRAVMIKHERYLDTYDLCFAHYFGGAEAPEGLHDALESWLSQPLPLPELSPEDFERLEQLDLDRLRELFEERLKEQTERHDGGNRWIGTGGTSPLDMAVVSLGNKSGRKVEAEAPFRSQESGVLSLIDLIESLTLVSLAQPFGAFDGSARASAQMNSTLRRRFDKLPSKQESLRS